MTIAIMGAGLKLATSRTLFKGVYLARKYAPEILTSVGIAGFVVTAVMGAKATLKLEPVVDKLNDDLTRIKDIQHIHPEADIKRDKIRVYTHAVTSLGKTYGPTVALGIGSAVCIVSAHGIMRRRNVALVAAYQILEKSFTNYRERVIEEYGDDKDLEYRSGLKTESIKEGNKSVQVTSELDRIKGASPYGRWFDQLNSTEWNKLPEYNLMTLRAQQEYANQKLQIQGYLFLNDVYDSLGIERSQAGQVVGWYIDKNRHSTESGDCYVDFGIYDFASEGGRRFISGNAPGIFLDFNVDGVIVDKLI